MDFDIDDEQLREDTIRILCKEGIITREEAELLDDDELDTLFFKSQFDIDI